MNLKERARKLALIGGLALMVAQMSLPFAPSVEATNIGNQGCTLGYWKNHTSNWEEYTPDQLVGGVFDLSGFPDLADDTLLEALNYPGGPGVEGGARILLKQAVAAFLNAAHEGLGYPYRRFVDPFNIEAKVNAALDGSRDDMIALAGVLDAANNLGCPLN